jgi:riboflavin transporter FmnP
MLKEYKTKTNIFILLGILTLLVSNMMSEKIGPLVALVAVELFIVGCCYYAKSKGYHGAWGLLGLLSVIGLIVLVCMRDKHKGNKASCKHCDAQISDNSTLCPSCEKSVAPIPSIDATKAGTAHSIPARILGGIVFIVLILIGTYLARMTSHVLVGYIVGAAAFIILKSTWNIRK